MSTPESPSGDPVAGSASSPGSPGSQGSVGGSPRAGSEDGTSAIKIKVSRR